MAVRLSIRYKILGVLGVLLLTAVALYTFLASSIFKQEKMALLYDMNHSLAVNLAAQLRSAVLQTSNQMQLHLYSELYSGGEKVSQKSLKEARIQGISIFQAENGVFTEVPGTHTLPLTGIDKEKIQKYLEKASTYGNALWVETGNTPKYFLASEIEVHQNSVSKKYLSVAELDPALFFAPIQSANLFRSYLTNRAGEVVLSFDKSTLVKSPPIESHPLLKAAVNHNGTTSGVLAFEDQNEEWYGAYAPLGIADLYFLSQTNRSEVATATKELIERSVLFGLIALTVTFMASILFSRRLTGNLHLLTKSTQSIGEGKLSTQINIRSGDEVEELANSFNAMAEALKASRDAIERYNRELEEKVALRTQQLHETNASIKEVQEQLLKSTQLAAVGEVAGKTAHDVLNPLTAIASRIERTRKEVQKTRSGLPLQFSEILTAWDKEIKNGGIQKLFESLTTPSSLQPAQTLFEEDFTALQALCRLWAEEQKEIGTSLEFVQDQAERIHRIIDQMRQLVRSSDVKEDIHCHDLLHQAVSTLRDFTQKNGVGLEEDFRAELDSAHLNRDEFIQIITNLLRNAYQAIAALGDLDRRYNGVIRVKTFNEGDFLKVEIRDNGTGIPVEKQSQVFEQGFTTKGPAEGTGLGLAICRRYARAFGGEVELVSSSPEGTTFCLRVPLQKDNVYQIAV